VSDLEGWTGGYGSGDIEMEPDVLEEAPAEYAASSWG